MYYPWWHVPVLTSPMIIAVIAVLHVLVSHYAVGGGILLARENRFALKKNDRKYRDYWHRHARFFILLTVVYGAISGVGIWWTIGLASPLATEMLIRTFVFGWAIEWVFFILELVAAFGFYYFWDTMRPRSHWIVGGIYAFAAWVSLVLITGITSFMLNSQSLLALFGFGTAPDQRAFGFLGEFWQAFFNVQFLPQMILRTGGALILATCYIYLHASLGKKNAEISEKIVKRMFVPSMVGIALVGLGIVGWLLFLPKSSVMMLERAAALNIFLGFFAAILAAMILLIFLIRFTSTKKLSPALTAAFFLMGLAAVSIGEFVREAVRKPFVVDQNIYGNQIYLSDVEKMQSDGGVLYNGIWTRLYLEELQKKYPDLNISPERFVYEKPKIAIPQPIEEIPVPAENTTSVPVLSTTPEISARETSPTETSVMAASAHETSVFSTGVDGEEQIVVLTAMRQADETPTRSQFTPMQQPKPLERTPKTETLAQNVPLSNASGENISELGNASPENAVPASKNALNPPASTGTTPETGQNPPSSDAAQLVMDTQDTSENAQDGATSENGDSSENNVQKTEEVQAAPLVFVPSVSRKGNPDLLKLSTEDRIDLGRTLFMYHCNDCHAASHGYSAVGPLLTGKTKKEIERFLPHLNRPGFYMPPWIGSDVEASLLAEYLVTLRAEMPINIGYNTISEE